MTTVSRAYPNSGANATRSLAFSLVWGIAVFTMPVPSVAEGLPAQHTTQLRELQGEEYGDAQKASGAADLLRAAFQARYSWHPSSEMKPTSEDGKHDAEQVIAAYTRVIDSYPNTEIAAYSGIRLAGFYQYLGQTAKAIEKAKEVASAYGNTQYAPNANFTVGLLYLQAAHDPAAAMEWFQKIPRPSTDTVVTEQTYNEHEKLYLAAQQSVAKCALAVGRHDVAQERYARLTERYPMYRDSIRKDQENAQGGTSVRPVSPPADKMIEQGTADVQETAVPSSAVDNVTQSPLPAVSVTPVPAADTPAVHSDKSNAGRHWAGGALLLVGVALCASGIIYGLRTRKGRGGLR